MADGKNENNFVDESSDDKESLSSFQRRNSSRFRSSMYNNKSFRRQAPADRLNPTETEKDAENSTTSSSGLHIAPLLPFKTTSTPTVLNNNHHTSSSNQPKERVKSLKSEETKTKTKKSNEFSTNDFDSMFSAEKTTLEQSDSHKNKPHSKVNKTNFKESDSSGIDSFFNELTSNKTAEEDISKYFIDAKTQPVFSPKAVVQLPEIVENANDKEKINKHPEEDEEDEHIDWASSEDEEAVQKEIESFEKNKVSKRFKYLSCSLSTTQTNLHCTCFLASCFFKIIY